MMGVASEGSAAACPAATPPLGLFVQPACLQHRYIRHPNSSHIFERPERLRAVLLGVAAAVARLEEAESVLSSHPINGSGSTSTLKPNNGLTPSKPDSDDLSGLLSGLSISSFPLPSRHLDIVTPPKPPLSPGQILLHHPALQLAHSPPCTGSMHTESLTTSSSYLKDLYKWASEAVNAIKETGCEIPSGMGLNQGDLYLGPGSIIAIEGAIQTVCQAIDKVCNALITAANRDMPIKTEPAPSTPPANRDPTQPFNFDRSGTSMPFSKAFCAIRPPGHHCGEDAPSGFCYVNNVVVGALHAYLEHDIDRAIIIDFDLHHGNGTQALVMPLNAASHAEDIAVKGGKPNPPVYGKKGKRRRGWKGFYGSVHDIYSYPCEDGDLDLVKDASLSLAAHGQYIENIHLQSYTSEEDFYERIYPKYSALLEKARMFMEETEADPDRTIVLISAGFDACEHEHQLMQRHDRRVPTSFFSRYTRDIVRFADKYTEGKIVSVLEGGYSDRALTSAAMGHVIGMLDRPGDPSWWTEAELTQIERATKKKRTGPLAPFPKDLSHIPYLARTHALLGHFEPPSESAPSAASTPQQVRRTLRDRTKLGHDDGGQDSTPTSTVRRGRGRGGVASTPSGTPRNATPSGRRSRAVTPAKGSIPVNRDPLPDIPAIPAALRALKDDPDSTPTAKSKGMDPSRVPLPASPAADRTAPAAPGVHAHASVPKIVPHQPSPLRPNAIASAGSRSTGIGQTGGNALGQLHPMATPGTSSSSTGNGPKKIILRISRTPSPVGDRAPAREPPSPTPVTEALRDLVVDGPVRPKEIQQHRQAPAPPPFQPSGYWRPASASASAQTMPMDQKTEDYPPPAWGSGSIYPSLRMRVDETPGDAAMPYDHGHQGGGGEVSEMERYRELSAGTTSSEGRGDNGGYNTATSGMTGTTGTSDDQLGFKRDGSVGSSTSSGPAMPGRFGR